MYHFRMKYWLYFTRHTPWYAEIICHFSNYVSYQHNDQVKQCYRVNLDNVSKNPSSLGSHLMRCEFPANLMQFPHHIKIATRSYESIVECMLTTFDLQNQSTWV